MTMTPANQASPPKRMQDTLPYKIGAALNFVFFGLLWLAAGSPVVLALAKLFGVVTLGWVVIFSPWLVLLALALIYMMIFAACAGAINFVMTQREPRSMAFLNALGDLQTTALAPGSRANPGKAH